MVRLNINFESPWKQFKNVWPKIIQNKTKPICANVPSAILHLSHWGDMEVNMLCSLVLEYWCWCITLNWISLYLEFSEFSPDFIRHFIQFARPGYFKLAGADRCCKSMDKTAHQMYHFRIRKYHNMILRFICKLWDILLKKLINN